MNFYVQEHMAAEHRQEVQKEMEQQRLLASLSPRHVRPIRHGIALFGVLLIKLGTRLKQVDFQPVPHYSQY